MSKKGYKQTKKHIEKRKQARLDYKPTKETKEKQKQARLGKKMALGKHWKIKDTSNMKKPKSEKHRKKIKKNHAKYWENKTFTDEHIKKLSGENNPHWRGGISNNPYPKKFNNKLKLKIRIRDNFICCLCGRTEREELEELNRVLCVNHIDFNKNNCKENNLNTLCLKCNVKINREREYWTDYFNKLIFN